MDESIANGASGISPKEVLAPTEDNPAAMAQPPGSLLMDRMLAAVRRARLKQDEEHGILRDYRDGTAGSRYHGPGPTTDRQRVLDAQQAFDEARRAGMHSWRHFLELAVAEALAEADEQRLKAKLVEVAATACAWAEGIEVRADDRRIAREQKAMVMQGKRLVPFGAPWWSRLWAWLRGK